MPTARKAVVTDETIRVHAYHLWEKDGRPHGRDQEFWQRAAAELAAVRPETRRKPASRAAKPRAAKAVAARG
ncbi:MAG TPA: DUF2934 domain-containing protein [Devosia sp.]|nr:DUF2934 domain-containing protein [Devosia sp.]